MGLRGPKKGQRFGGRQKGTPNKYPTLLKEAILRAAELAGGKEGLVGYLKGQAKENPASFIPLLGKVLPLQITGDKENPLPIILGSMTEQEASEAYERAIKGR